jgi:flagellar basal-body rod protein FlgG
LSAQAGGLTPPSGQGLSPELQARTINLRDLGTNISISQQGEIYAGEDLVGKLSVVEFSNPNKLRKVGSSLYENKDTVGGQPSVKTIVRQGVIETSNVSPIEEMTNLIKANRMFEQDLKAMKVYNEMLGREVNDIGKF